MEEIEIEDKCADYPFANWIEERDACVCDSDLGADQQCDGKNPGYVFTDGSGKCDGCVFVPTAEPSCSNVYTSWRNGECVCDSAKLAHTSCDGKLPGDEDGFSSSSTYGNGWAKCDNNCELRCVGDLSYYDNEFVLFCAFPDREVHLRRSDTNDANCPVNLIKKSSFGSNLAFFYESYSSDKVYYQKELTTTSSDYFECKFKVEKIN